MNNVVLVSGVQQSDSVIHIHVSILFQILFPFRLLQSIEQSSLCYTVDPCRLSILNIVVCICQSQTSNLSLPAKNNGSFQTHTHSLHLSLYLCIHMKKQGNVEDRFWRMVRKNRVGGPYKVRSQSLPKSWFLFWMRDYFKITRGLPWRSSGQDSALPLQGAQVQALVGELRSCMLCGMAKKIFFFVNQLTFFPLPPFWPHHMICRVLVPQPGIEPGPPTVEGQSLNH